jgi:REP element-mobilizing transposase RayT
MPRALRQQYAGAWHHVVNRGANRQATFLDPTDHLTFLALMAEIVRRYPVEIHAYCLMTNHFHLLVRTVDPVLDTSIQFLKARYTRLFNDRHGRDGPLFRGRYWSTLVETEQYLAAVSRYIHRNAVAIVGDRIVDYPWSSYPVYQGARAAEPWLSTEFTLAEFGGRERYSGFVETDFLTEVDQLLSATRPPTVLSASLLDSKGALTPGALQGSEPFR